MDDGFQYTTGAYITGAITFLVIWIYSFFAWGFLIGLAIGWLPAIIGAFILGLLWPLVLFILLCLIVFILYSL